MADIREGASPSEEEHFRLSTWKDIFYLQRDRLIVTLENSPILRQEAEVEGGVLLREDDMGERGVWRFYKIVEGSRISFSEFWKYEYEEDSEWRPSVAGVIKIVKKEDGELHLEADEVKETS